MKKTIGLLIIMLTIASCSEVSVKNTESSPLNVKLINSQSTVGEKKKNHLSFINYDDHVKFIDELNKLTDIINQNGKLLSVEHASAMGNNNKVVYSAIVWWEQ